MRQSPSHPAGCPTLLLVLVLLSLRAVNSCPAQEPPPAEGPLPDPLPLSMQESNLLELMEKELKQQLPSWIRDFTIVTAGGYNDNVALANEDPSASPFIHTGIEAFFSRIPSEDKFFDAVDSFLLFDDIRFTDAPDVEKEQLAFVQGTVRKKIGENWRLSLTAEYLYIDQVIDVSDDNSSVVARQVLATNIVTLGHSGTLEPGVRRNFGADNWIDLSFPVNRQYFEEPIDDYWSFGPKVNLVHAYGNRSQFNVGYDVAFRRFDSAQALDAEGFRVPGTADSREQDHHEIRFGWRHYWDPGRRWRTYLRGSFKITRDNFEGYFDYQKPSVSLQIRYRAPSWEVSGEARYGHYDYPVQKATRSDDLRKRDEVILSVRGEKQLAKFLLLFAEYEFERTYANDPLDRIEINKVTGGLRWQF